MNDGRHLVLVVDDAPDVGVLVKVRLNLEYPNEFEVRTVSSGLDRLVGTMDLWSGVDALVLDLALEPLGLEDDPYATARRIFTFGREQNPSMPIIVFSAIVGLRHAPDLEGKADRVVLKPNLSDAVEAIAALLGVSRALPQ